MNLHAQEHVYVRVECYTPKHAVSPSANTGNGCAGAGALCRPRVNACVCVYPCRFSDRPWEPIHCRPEPEGAADERRNPHMRDNLYPHWPIDEVALGTLAHDLLQVDAGRQEEQRRKRRKRSRCVLIDRTKEGRCLR